MSLWQGGPLVLASKSSARRALLEAAGIPIVVDPADIDERASEASAPDGKAAAVILARTKAAAVAKRRPNDLVLGADQTLDLDSRRFSKPKSVAAAREQLAALAGRTHSLHSAAAVARGNDVLFETVATARLTMRPLDAKSLDAYLAAAVGDVTTSVGAYRLEGLGVHLFEKIEGDHFTILGLPLLALLAYFRGAGLLR
ncbi:MAG TPA: Maf family protein [Xanthobacteraceae bacterium]|nr:Maf family protein [Xanthobacteraceae bacterium]